MVLTYRGSLPPGALLRPRAPAPHWFHGPDAAVGAPGDANVRHWSARAGSGQASAVDANSDGTQVQPEQGLVFSKGVNGGLVLPGAAEAAERMSFGLVFTPGVHDPETLVTLQPVGQGRYLYLAARAGLLRAAHSDGGLLLEMPLGAGHAPRLAICALSDGRARLSLDGGAPAVADFTGAVPQGPAALYIGCRGQRRGLKGKLGAFTLHDLFIWPDADILAAPDDPSLAAVLAYFRGEALDGI